MGKEASIVYRRRNIQTSSTRTEIMDSTSRRQNMIRITQQRYRNTILFCNFFNDSNHRAGIYIHKYLHLSLSPLNPYKNKLCCSYSASCFS